MDNKINAEIFRSRLKTIRENKEWTQEKLAKKIGLPPSQISHMEKGRRVPSFYNLIKLAQGLNVSLDCLIGHAPKELICREVWATPEHWKKIKRFINQLTTND